MAGVNKNEQVSLKATDVKDPKPRLFPFHTAKTLLNLPNSAWELADKKFELKGTELIKK